MDKIFQAINKSKTDRVIRNWAGGIAQCSRASKHKARVKYSVQWKGREAGGKGGKRGGRERRREE